MFYFGKVIVWWDEKQSDRSKTMLIFRVDGNHSGHRKFCVDIKRLGSFIAMWIYVVVFWVMTPCSDVVWYQS